MRPIDDPSYLTPDERLSEVASILAAGILRLRMPGRTSGDDPAPEKSSEFRSSTALSFPRKPCSVSTVVNGSETPRQGETHEPERRKRGRRAAADDRRRTAGEVRRGVRRRRRKARHKEWLVRRIAWRLQALAEGDLSERARQRAAELANDADLRITAPKPARLRPTRQRTIAPATIDVPATTGCPCPARSSPASTRARRSRSGSCPTDSSSRARSTGRSAPWPRRSPGHTATATTSSASAGKEVQNDARPKHATSQRPAGPLRRSTPASPPKRAWTRSSTRWTPSGNRARRTSPARGTKAGTACPTATTTAGSPAATWTARR